MAWEIEVQSQVVIPKAQKMVLNASLLNTQHYKVHIKGKVGQLREKSSTLCEVAIEKGTFKSPSTMFANFTFYNTSTILIELIAILKDFDDHFENWRECWNTCLEI